MAKRRAVLIAGPTASGKSAKALEIATRDDGVIVNTDAMQVYAGLAVLTAQPSAAEQASVPHWLYGFVPPATRFSTGAFADATASLLADPELQDRTLIFVGGTGLYFEALVTGISAIPPVSDSVVASVSGRVRGASRAERMAMLQECDPELAARLGEADFQRTVRALAVFEATGHTISFWQAKGKRPLLDRFDLTRMVISPPTDVLAERIARRFPLMLQGGAIEEVRALLAQNLDPGLPAMKAIGVPQIARMLANEVTEAETAELAIIATRQYAKRQRTWARRHMTDWEWSS